MSLLDIFKKKNTEPEDNQNTLEQDIKASCEWVIRALNSSGYKADYNVLFLFESVYRIYHLTYSNNSSNLSYIEFIDLNSAMKYIEKDYTENYL